MKFKFDLKGYFLSSGSKNGKNGVYYYADILDTSSNCVSRIYSSDDIFSAYKQFDEIQFPCVCHTDNCYMRVDLT